MQQITYRRREKVIEYRYKVIGVAFHLILVAIKIFESVQKDKQTYLNFYVCITVTLIWYAMVVAFMIFLGNTFYVIFTSMKKMHNYEYNRVRNTLIL